MVAPWRDAGYRVLAVDIQRDGTDILRWLPPRTDYHIVFAFPPCTNLAVSGARWFRDKGLAGLGAAIELVERARDICEWTGAPWMLENPVSTLSTYWRQPDHVFHPHDFAGLEPDDNYTKKTCLWTGGGFVMPRPVPLLYGAIPDDRIHRATPGPERANFRSATPMGFARAVYLANRGNDHDLQGQEGPLRRWPATGMGAPWHVGHADLSLVAQHAAALQQPPPPAVSELRRQGRHRG